MVRFWDLGTHAEQATSLNAWSRFEKSYPWFLIPSTLGCPCTYARDELEAFYIDQKHQFVQEASELFSDVEFKNLSLLHLSDALVDRMWNRPVY